MKVKLTYKQIIQIALPISLAQLIPQVNFLTNTIFLGRLGEEELGVNGVAGVFYLALAMIGQGMSNGVQVLMSRKSGEGNQKAVHSIFTTNLLLSILLSSFLLLFAQYFAPFLFGMTLDSATNYDLSMQFIKTRVWGLPFLMLNQIVIAFCLSTGRSRYLVWSSLAATIVNVVLDYAFIFGVWGFEARGLQGAALASVLAEIVGLITILSIVFFFNKKEMTQVFKNIKWVNSIVKSTLVISLPLVIQFIFSIGGWQLFFIFVEHLGEQALAGSQVLRSVIGVVGIATWSLAATTNIMVSNFIGQNQLHKVIPTIKKIGGLSLLVTAVLVALLMLFAEPFLLMYVQDLVFVSNVLPTFYFVCIAMLCMSISTVIFNGVVGTGQTTVNLIIEIICVLLYILYCYLVIERARLPLIYAWGSEYVYWLSLIVMSSLYLWKGNWKQKLARVG